MSPPKYNFPQNVDIRMNRAGPDAAALAQVKEDANWDALDPNAKLASLRRAILVLMDRNEQDNDSLLGLLKTFVQDGERTVVRRDLVIGKGADIVIDDN